MKEIKVGIIGFGTVGAGVAANLLQNGDVIAKRIGVKPVLAGIADLDITTDRGVAVPQELLTTDSGALIAKSDVVVELIGGTGVACDLILKALKLGKPVVTANKALLATKGDVIFAAAEAANTNVYYEASVAGGIPVIKALREGLVANRITRIYGIMNGTCNYILTRMEAEGADFATVLADAQKLGYAEANPGLDIDGFDTAHKAAVLASLAYGEWFGLDPVHVEGIRAIEQADLKFADQFGYRIKLLATIKQIDGDVQIRVHPTLIPKDTLLASISGVFNGVLIEGDTVGQTLFYGRGAGRAATASAVVADIADVALDLKFGSHRRVPAFRPGAQYRRLVPMDDIESRYYLRFKVTDAPGVVAAITDVLARNGISIAGFVQPETDDSADKGVSVFFTTHLAREKAMKQALQEIDALPVVREPGRFFRIEEI